MFTDDLNFKDIILNHIMISDIIKVEGKNTPLYHIIEKMLKNNAEVTLLIEKQGLKEIPIGFIEYTHVMKFKSGELELKDAIPNDKNIIVINDKEELMDIIAKVKESSVKYIPIVKESKIIGLVKRRELLNLYNLYKKMINRLNTGFENILENIQEAVCVVDKKGVVKYWNKGCEKLYRINRDEILNKPISEYFPNALLPRVIEEEKPYENVYNSPRKNCHIIISAKPLYENGKLIGGISCDRDISEMIELSELLNKTKTSLQVLRQEVSKINESKYSFSKIVGKSTKIKQAIDKAKRVAKSNISVLLTGESGTGKEIFARAIHVESGRKGCFIPINCSAIPKDLLESELFGYESGAFTGAHRKGKIGKFELAHEGTLFLDEIGDMPLNMQPKILRVLEDGVITKVGGDNSKRVDVRLIAASNKDLEKMMHDGLFRKDLYYRLNAISIHLPPLRERKDDIPELINKFLKDFSLTHRVPIPTIPPRIMKILMKYDWEGNVRELKNVVETIVILSKSSNHIDESFLPDRILKFSRNDNAPSENGIDLNEITENAEKDAIKKAMKLAKGNKSKAAQLLKIPRSTLYFKLKQYNITCN